MRSPRQITTAGILFLMVLLFLLTTGIADVVKRGCGFLFIPSFTPTLTNTSTPTFTGTPTETPTKTAVPTFTDTPTLTVTPTQTIAPTDTLTPTSTMTSEFTANTLIPTIDETALAAKIYAEAAETMEAVFIALTPAEAPTLPEEEPDDSMHMVNPADQKTLFFVRSNGLEFWMDWNEVSNKEYRTCVDAGICSAPHSESCGRIKDYYDSSEYADYPAVNVDFSQAEIYCRWAGMTLMSLAEWKAAAGLPVILSEEANLDRINNAPVCSDEVSHLYGNVWEWTRDKKAGDLVIIAGGSWLTSGRDRSRTGSIMGLYSADDLGFRCVKPAD